MGVYCIDCGEGKRQNEFAEWHNYAKYEIYRMT